jgi:FkbM family methyltransferase
MKILEAGARIVFGKLLPRLPYPVLRGPLRGSRYILGATAGAAGGVSVHLGFQEVEQSRCLTSLLRTGQVFFDVGANVGYYSLLASKILHGSGRVIAFEPSPRNLAFLYRHVRLNKAKNVTILPLACADALSAQLFFGGENNAMGRLGEIEGEPSRAAETLIATISIDRAAELLKLRPDVIKIDVEGAERQVLEGAIDTLTRLRPAVLLSVHSDELRENCLLRLREFDYQIEPLNSSSIASATEFLARPSAHQDSHPPSR